MTSDVRYEIVTWDWAAAHWTTDGLGDSDENVFESEREAEEALEELRNVNLGDWRTARYGVRQVGSTDVDEAYATIELAYDNGMHSDNPGWLVSVNGSSWQPGPDLNQGPQPDEDGEPDIEDARSAAAELRKTYPRSDISWEGGSL